MLRLLNPYPEINPNHPVLERETRQMRWIQRAGSPQRYSRWIILLVIGLVLALYIGWLTLKWLNPYRFPHTGWFVDTTSGFVGVLALASLLASLLLDYLSLTAALSSISREMVAGTWDLLRLTSIREGELVLAKHTAAQLRAWRATMAVIGLRIAVGILIVVLQIARSVAYGGNVLAGGTQANQALFLVLNLIPLAALFGVYILEPVWRMRAVTAVGMSISARHTEGTSSVLVGIGMLLIFWLIQLVMIIAVVAGLTVLMFTIAAFGIGAFCAPLLLFLVISPTAYGFYSVIKTWGLRQVARRVGSFSR